jgi:hypothetical protein
MMQRRDAWKGNARDRDHRGGIIVMRQYVCNTQNRPRAEVH